MKMLTVMIWLSQMVKMMMIHITQKNLRVGNRVKVDVIQNLPESTCHHVLLVDKREGKHQFEEDEYSAEDSDSDEDFKNMIQRGAHLRKSNARSSMSTKNGGRNNEVRTSSRSVRKVSYVESDESEEIGEGKKKKAQKDEVEEEDGDSIERVLWHQPRGTAEDAM
ncbi:hypothetical protein OIU78_008069, partial [Salix suchowensis]